MEHPRHPPSPERDGLLARCPTDATMAKCLVNAYHNNPETIRQAIDKLMSLFNRTPNELVRAGQMAGPPLNPTRAFTQPVPCRQRTGSAL